MGERRFEISAEVMRRTNNFVTMVTIVFQYYYFPGEAPDSSLATGQHFSACLNDS